MSLRNELQKIINYFGFILVKKNTFENLYQKTLVKIDSNIDVLKINNNQGADLIIKKLMEENQTLNEKIAFSRTNSDSDIFEKERALIDSVEDFGKIDFANLTPWIFSSSLTNHRIIHQRIDEASLLWLTVKKTSGRILEIGRAAGGSTIVLLGASDNRIIDSIERFPQHSEVSNYIFNRKENINRLNLINQNSRDPILKNEYGMLFIDGDHSFDGLCHDIAKFWNNLKGQDGKPALAVFHDAAENPISYVESVRLAVQELLNEMNVAKVVGSWGSMLLLEKISDIDPATWYSKIDKNFWSTLCESEIKNQDIRSDVSLNITDYLGKNLLNGDNFDSPDWKYSGLEVKTTDKFGADNPLRLLYQKNNLGLHSFSSKISLDIDSFYISIHVRPLGIDKIKLGIYSNLLPFLELFVNFSNTPEMTCAHANNFFKIIKYNINFRNGYFDINFIINVSEVLSADDLNFAIYQLDEFNMSNFYGDENKGLAINSASIRKISYGESNDVKK